MALFIISLVAGVLTVLAPCILPLLPVIVGRSLTDTTLSKRRLFVVVASLGLSIILFTLLLKASTLFIDIPQDFWKWFSGGIIFIFGLISFFPELWEKFSFTATISQKSNVVMIKGFKKDTVWGDIIVGASLGPIFSACSPTYFVILATVLPVSLYVGILYLFAFSLGLALSLVFVALIGQKIVSKLGIVSDPRGWFKRIIGLIFIIVAIGIVSGYDKKFQVSILDAGFLDVTKIEQRLLDKNTGINGLVTKDSTFQEATTSETSKEVPKNEINFLTLAQKNIKYKTAPELSSIDGYINTNNLPITLSQYKGKKVVLLDIWTYSCINCQRTLPYLNSWYTKYEDKGLVIIGLHTPEFSFEKVQKNVENAVEKYDIKYPVVLDNDFSTWNAYENMYWPRKYLIDIDGFIVYDHAGEGNYDVTEKVIQQALSERNARIKSDIMVPTIISAPKDVMMVESNKVRSPEIYFGESRSKKSDNVTLLGSWDFTPEFAENNGEATIVYTYDAKNVYLVGGSKNGVLVEIYRDGTLLKKITIKAEQLYNIVEGDSYGEHLLEIKVKDSGLRAFTFTFG